MERTIERLEEVYESIVLHKNKVIVPSRAELREWESQLDWVLKEFKEAHISDDSATQYDKGYDDGYEQAREDIINAI